MRETLQIDGIDVLIEGEGTHTVLMLHGWPDTPALWDSTVAALQDGYRCARLALPGYDLSRPPRPMPVVQMTAFVGNSAMPSRSCSRREVFSCGRASLAPVAR